MTTPDPSARLSRDVVAKVARLARLELNSDELDLMTTQLAGMLEHFSDIDKIDLEGVAPLAQPLPLKNVLRDDVVVPGLNRDEVLAVAPAAEDGRFRVPPTIGFQE